MAREKTESGMRPLARSYQPTNSQRQPLYYALGRHKLLPGRAGRMAAAGVLIVGDYTHDNAGCGDGYTGNRALSAVAAGNTERMGVDAL
jgi:hypothetical protein